MKTAIRLALVLLALSWAPAMAQQKAPAAQDEPADQEQVQSDISTREIAIQSNFTGIEILIFGSVESSDLQPPGKGAYDVIAVVRGPSEPIVVRKKERVAGIWVNGPGKTYGTVPGFYAVLSTRPFRAIASDEMLNNLDIGLSDLEFGRYTKGNPEEQAYRSAMIRLMKQKNLFQEHDDGVKFIGRSLFRATVALPVNVPTGRYSVDVYLFRDGAVASKSEGSLEVTKAGIEAVLYQLAFKHPFVYGLLGVAIAVLAGLAGWYAFRRD
ncbi:MAG: TIGR02186 family protein [Methyloceanibacter sp.]|uniref:TIGR02186 family protein n=1 Tax=Methyloceanibacter sp. TaxID=1965321 RepID=UPI003D6D2E4D